MTFDPIAATNAYLATVPADMRARSDAYFEGSYWLQGWTFLAGLIVAWVLLRFRLSRRMREIAERTTRFRSLQVALYWVEYLLFTSLVTFPIAIYIDFVREHQYRSSTQTFAAYLADQAKGLAVGMVLGALAMMVLYAVFRRFPRTWGIWAAAVLVVFSVAGVLLFPVFIAPIFNTYAPLEDARIRDPILQLAHANGIETDRVYEVDASRQTNKISANVSGFGRTQRITLNDNLLKRCSPEEIQAVMAHEIGHYALNHPYENILFSAVVIVLGSLFVRGVFNALQRRYGERWGVKGVADPAGLPLLVALLSIWSFVLTPVQNSYIRSNEAEADLFGLNAARQPAAFATVSLKLGEYRKLEPGPWEEILMFDHPSGRSRILMAMTWKEYQE